MVFHLALTFGLEEDPIRALELTVGLIEETARRHGTADAVQASFGVSDGTKLWAVRYASDGSARSLFASNDVQAIRHLYPDNERLQRLSDDDRLIVSEPFSDLPGVWQEIPQATAVTVERGGVLEERPFRPAYRSLGSFTLRRIGGGSATRTGLSASTVSRSGASAGATRSVSSASGA